jgi:cell division protein FtsQ
MLAPDRLPLVHPRIGRRRAEIARARARRRRRALGALAAAAFLGVGALVVLHSPLFAARHLEVAGAVHESRAQVLSAAGVEGHPPLVDVDAGAAQARLEALPWVRRARVTRLWPDTLRIVVSERRPVAVLPGSGARQGRWALVDATGRVLAWSTARPAALPTLVVPVRVPGAGASLGPGARPALLAVVAAAGRLPLAVSAVKVGPGGAVTLVLAGGVQAELGPARQLSSKVAALRSVLLGAPASGPEVVDVEVPGEPTVGPASS